MVNTTGPRILGLPTCRDMKLITLNYSLTTATSPGATKPTPKPSCNADAKEELLIQYEDCFKGVAFFRGSFTLLWILQFHQSSTPHGEYLRHYVNHLKRNLMPLSSKASLSKWTNPLTGLIHWSALQRATAHFSCVSTPRTSTVPSSDYTTAPSMRSYQG